MTQKHLPPMSEKDIEQLSKLFRNACHHALNQIERFPKEAQIAFLQDMQENLQTRLNLLTVETIVETGEPAIPSPNSSTIDETL